MRFRDQMRNWVFQEALNLLLCAYQRFHDFREESEKKNPYSVRKYKEISEIVRSFQLTPEEHKYNELALMFKEHETVRRISPSPDFATTETRMTE